MATITQFEYVIALDQCRHFGRAATLCHVSQPTLSAQLQKLEDELGVVLFDRSKQPVLPTEEGRALIEQAKVVVNEVHRLRLLANRNAEEQSGEFRLGVIPTVAPYLAPLFLRDFSERYPRIELFIEELPTGKIIEALDRDVLDAGILATPLGLARIEETPLYYEPFYVYVGPGHRLAPVDKVAESMLDPGELWLLSEEHCLREQVIVVCGQEHRRGCFPSVHLKGGSLETVLELISRGAGYTLLPQMIADAVGRRRAEGRIIPLARPAPAREVSLVRRRGYLKRSMTELLQARIEANLPASLPRSRSRSFRVLDLMGQFR